MKRVNLAITGMHCGHCVHAVREALAAVPGVQVEQVEIGSASVSLSDDSAGVTPLIDAVYEAGYEAEEALR